MAEEKKEKVTVERLDPLAIPDYIFEEMLGIPSPGTVIKTLIPAPRRMAKILEIPTPAEIFKEAAERLEKRAKEVARR